MFTSILPISHLQDIFIPIVSVNFYFLDVPVKELSYPLNHNEQWKQLTLLMKRNIKTESIKIEVTIVKCLKCV